MRTAALVRTPLELRPSDIGTRVAIDGAFVRLVPGQPMGLPYDEARQQWIATAAPGQWVIGFAPPKAIGRLRPKHFTNTPVPHVGLGKAPQRFGLNVSSVDHESWLIR